MVQLMDDILCSSGTLAASAEVLVTTDVCLKAFEDEDHPALKLSLLVNYDLPAKKVSIMFMPSLKLPCSVGCSSAHKCKHHV